MGLDDGNRNGNTVMVMVCGFFPNILDFLMHEARLFRKFSL